MIRSDARAVVIVGLGLIGGSLAAACRRAFPRMRIVGVSRDPSALRKAQSRGWIHEGHTNIESAMNVGIPPLHLIVLCTPVDTLKNFLLRIDRIAPRGTIVTDAGSVKGFLVRWSDQRKWRRIRFVGAHPMAGSHERGIDAARRDLFKRSLVFVAPGRTTSKPALQTVGRFWKRVCQKILKVSPETHDRMTAQVSHVPHLLAALLVASASSKARAVASSGFLDTTRVAQGDARLWAPIFLENEREVRRVLRKLGKGLKRLEKILHRRDSESLVKFLRDAQKRRRMLELSA